MPSRYIDRNTPRTQLDGVLIRNPKSTFFTDTFAGGGEQFFKTDIAEWDFDRYKQPVARYVGEDLIVEPTERSPFTTKELETPILMERRVITARDVRKRGFGENIFDAPNPIQRLKDLHKEDLEFCADAVDNLIEHQWAQFMTNRIIPIVGHGVNRVLDYNEPGFEGKEVLAGGNRWGEVGVNIIDSMNRVCSRLARYGHMVDEIYMSTDVWKIILEDDRLLKLLDVRRLELGNLRPEKLSKYGAARVVGALTDPYVTLFTQESTVPSTTIPHMPAGTVIYSTPDAKRNKSGFGSHLYKDLQTNSWKYTSARYIQEFRSEAEPPREEVRVISRHMPIPFDMRSWFVQVVR